MAWEKRSDPDRYAHRYSGMSDAMREGQRSQIGTDIADAFSAGTKLRKQAKLKGKFLALGGTQDDYDAIISGLSNPGTPGQPVGGSPVDRDQNPWTGYGPGEVGNQVPDWMSIPKNKWDAMGQAGRADWVQQQMQAENRKLAQAGLGEGIEDIQARLIDTPQLGSQDIANMRGSYESRLGMDEASEIQRIKADMARRGIQYDPSKGIGGGMTGFAGLKRQMGAAQAGRDLDIYANQTNRAALERGIGAREGVRGNWANIGTGFGATPFTMPNPSEVMIMNNPNLLQPQSNQAASYMNAGGNLLSGAGAFIGAL